MKEVFKSAVQFFTGNLVSKFGGVIRDICMAAFFGVNPYIASFMVAYRFCHFFRRFFGESAMASAFVPHLEKIKKQHPDQAQLFYRDFLLVATFFLLGFVGIVSYSVRSIDPFLSADWQYINALFVQLLPSLIFITVFAINQAFLQTNNVYFLPAASPVALNIAWVVGIFVLASTVGETLGYRLCNYIVAGYALQAWITFLPCIRIVSIKAMLTRSFRYGKEILQLAGAGMLVFIGIGALQINALLDGIFAKIADPNGPAFLWYSVRIYQLPFSIFAVSLASALLPHLSRTDNMKDYLIPTGRKLLLFALPATCAMYALGWSGIELLFGRGAFNVEASLRTLQCLFALAMGLLPTCFVYIYSQAFYANHRYALPSLFSGLGVFLNLIFNSFFVFVLGWGVVSIGVATTLSAFVQGGCMLYYVGMYCPIDELIDYSYLKKVALSSLLALVAAWTVGVYLALPFLGGWYFTAGGIQRTLGFQVGAFVSQTASFLFVFILSSYRLGIPEIRRSVRLLPFVKKENP